MPSHNKMHIIVLTFHICNSPVKYSYDWLLPFYYRRKQNSIVKWLVQDHTLLVFARSREADHSKGLQNWVTDPPVLSHICRATGSRLPSWLQLSWAYVVCLVMVLHLCMDLVEVGAGSMRSNTAVELGYFLLYKWGDTTHMWAFPFTEGKAGGQSGWVT